MSKLKKLANTFSILIKKPYLINNIINDITVLKEVVVSENPQLEDGFPMLDFTDLLPNFNEKISSFSFLDGGSLITDLALIKGLVKKQAQSTYFEIGTFRGESIANLVNDAKTCFTLDLTDSDLKKIGCNQERINQHGFYSKKYKNITHLRGNSLEFDFSPYYKKCNVVFIDGDHKYEGVLNDTKIAFKLLKDEKSVIIWHDYASNPGKIRWDVLKGIYDGTPSDKKNNLYCVSNTLCAIFTNNPTKVIDSNLITPTKNFTVNIKAHKI